MTRFIILNLIFWMASAVWAEESPCASDCKCVTSAGLTLERCEGSDVVTNPPSYRKERWHLHRQPDLGWFYTGLSMRGSLADHDTNTGKVGVELGFNLPVWHGIDVGYHGGSYFKKDGDVQQAVETRIYLNQRNEGLYIGGGYQWDPEKQNHATLGVSFAHFYLELDAVKSSSRPYVAIGEFGLRWRFW